MVESQQKPAFIKTTSQILQPSVEAMLPVPLALWTTFMKRIEGAADSSSFYAAFGWWLLGVGASGILAAITFPASANFGTDTIYWGAVITEFGCVLCAVLGVICGLLSLWYAKQHKDDKKQLWHYVLEDMREFCDKHVHTPK